MKNNKSIEMIEIVAQGLGDLLDQIVFVGGSTTGLYIDDPGVPDVRPTDDVDCMIEISTRMDYYQFEDKLRKKRFIHSGNPGDPICRWKYLGIAVDIMPTDESILGFSSRWYERGHHQNESVILPSGQLIRILTAPYFLATKIEAFLGRGQNDFRTSSDFEDIISIFNGRTKIAAEILGTPDELKKYLGLHLRHFLSQSADLEEAIHGHLPYGSGASRVKYILEQMKEISTSG